MFDKYQLAVLEDYRKKKEGIGLLSSLSQPTPAGLKRECLAVFDRRYQRSDIMTLSSFFEPQPDEASYRLAIRRMDRDKFKSLNLILKKSGGKTDTKNIELLAWLTDFQPRPYAVWLKLSKDKPDEQEKRNVEQVQIGNDQESEEIITRPAETNEITADLVSATGTEVGKYVKGAFSRDRKLFRLSYKWLLTVTSAITMVAACLYFLKFTQGRERGCMVWTGETYRQVSCNDRNDHRGSQVIALDTLLQNHFKKITQDDTLTAASIGKVWCVKIDGSYEYYTDSGSHPLYPEKRLRRLTRYIMNNHPSSGN